MSPNQPPYQSSHELGLANPGVERQSRVTVVLGDTATASRVRVVGEHLGEELYTYPTTKEDTGNIRVETTPGTDLERTMADLKAKGLPVVEYGGPSPTGYKIIGNQLPQKPVIRNMAPVDGAISGDAGNMADRDGSVGVVLAAGLHLGRGKPGENMEILWQELEEYFMPPAGVKPGEHNLRVAFLREAKRVLAPGGLLVTRSVTAQEIRIGEALGLKLVMLAKRPQVIRGERQVHEIYDAVMRKSLVTVRS